MSIRTRQAVAFLLATAVLLPMTTALRAQDAAEKAPEEPAAEKATTETPDVDPYKVPDGTPEELFKFIDGLADIPPKVEGYQGMLDRQLQRAKATAEAAAKILASDVKLEQEQAERALSERIRSLRMLAQMGDQKAIDALFALPKQLEEAGHDDFVRPVQVLILQMRLMIESRKSPEAFEKVKAEALDFIKAGKDSITASELRIAQAVTQVSEMVARATDDPKYAADVYQSVADVLTDTSSETARGMAESFEAAARRLGLVGKKMQVAGFQLDGEAFNIDQWKDKVVLVDFWATWCGPCRAEVPNMKKLYEAYHDKGFEIVGVSVDENIGALEEYLQEEEIPWTIVADFQPDREDYKSIADNYGVSAIPTMILIGKDGNVASIWARGPELEQKLEEMLGSPETPKAE